MSGFADVGYADGNNQDGSFVVGNFSPIFHFQYKDMFMLESEIESHDLPKASYQNT